MQTQPQHIKLLAIDIDGTLLNSHKQITLRTRSAVRAAQQAGAIVTLATARRYYNTQQIANQLAIDFPLILYDGALIMQHPHGNIIHAQPLEAAIAAQAVQILMRHHIQPVIQHINGAIEETWTGHTEFDTQWVMPYFTTHPEHVARMEHSKLCIGQPDPLRVAAFASEEEIAGLIPEVSTLGSTWSTVTWGNYGCAELAMIHAGCSKATALHILAKHLGIPLEHVMAIGDNTNDLHMLQTVGWGVAMGQAPDAVKAAAHAITTSNAEDGAALAIERYILRHTTSVA